MKINLFALTGFGNIALKTLLKYKDINIVTLYTRKETDCFPYYDEEQLDSLAQKNNIDVKYIKNDDDWDIKDSVDLNLIVTFHRVFKKSHLDKGTYNINIHPSLLPSYKGPTPTNWIIHNKEKECGISAHFVSEEVDSGDIIYQESFPLLQQDDASLRKFLALKSENIIHFIILNFPDYNTIESIYEQSSYESFYKYKV
ncbi:formyltransferase family protein [Sulfurimonas sp.]|uniref:formyltransferase family protein n=1 Tax=Sulfurimonas sp. TaxID=2022749 RepID=UPI003569B9AD